MTSWHVPSSIICIRSMSRRRSRRFASTIGLANASMIGRKRHFAILPNSFAKSSRVILHIMSANVLYATVHHTSVVLGWRKRCTHTNSSFPRRSAAEERGSFTENE